MKQLFNLVLLLNFTFCFSQFGVISDSDGFVNVRSSAEIGENISDKLENGFVVYSFEPKGNWINIDYKKSGKELNGYIYKDRITYISDFENIPLKSNLNGKAKLEKGKIQIEISETSFNKEKHKLNFYKNTNQLDKIDDTRVFGTDGNIPKKEYKSIKVEIGTVKIELPNSAFKNLYEPNLSNSKANYDEKNDILYISSANSDDAGGYEIIWVIEKKQYKYRFEAIGF